jgi:hypothetical protein
MFAALKDLDAGVKVNTTWKMFIENIKISVERSLGYHELKVHKPWFNEGWSKLFNQRKQAKLQWLQGISEINRQNLNSVRHEASRHFTNKKKECLKEKINELAKNCVNKNIRDFYKGINEFK